MTRIKLDEIKQKANELGYDDIGVTSAKISKEDIEAYQRWLSRNYHGKMDYMENQIRCHPDELLPGAKTAILFVSYYKQPKLDFRENAGLIASYARGRDYHHVHRKRLKKFLQWFEERTGQPNLAKGFSDSTPILEKALAVQAGLGWFGKNTLLIHRKFGTFILLSGILTTLELPYTQHEERVARCGSCTRCLDACPTGAIEEPYLLNSTKCLSYHLIESKEQIPEKIRKQNPGYAFGCDMCQDACPHNLLKPISKTPDFTPDRGVGEYLTLETLLSIEQQPEQLFGTPLQRRKVHGLKRTMEIN